MIDIKKFKGLQWFCFSAILVCILTIIAIVVRGELGTYWFVVVGTILFMFFCRFFISWPKTWWPDDVSKWPESIIHEEEMLKELSESKITENPNKKDKEQ